MARKLFNKAWDLAIRFEQYDVQIQLLRMQSPGTGIQFL